LSKDKQKPALESLGNPQIASLYLNAMPWANSKDLKKIEKKQISIHAMTTETFEKTSCAECIQVFFLKLS
jgi:hypothetical protein